MRVAVVPRDADRGDSATAGDGDSRPGERLIRVVSPETRCPFPRHPRTGATVCRPTCRGGRVRCLDRSDSTPDVSYTTLPFPVMGRFTTGTTRTGRLPSGIIVR
jgi:hypothetical protein